MVFGFPSLLVLTSILLSLPISACCTAWRLGNKPVEIAAQDVLLIWDAKQKKEHFIRRASFETAKIPEDFGFLVPTPTQPQLSEISDSIFQELSTIIEPKIEIKKRTKLTLTPLVLLPWLEVKTCLLYTSPSPRDKRQSRMPSSA